ncbi:hypothetical protein M413DRAFT_441938 [Hebeloma cylindrosporum]|uniref:Uncharacterized protein n=1 Tax=Hebeloma cylindrosporum TaxID=76867 RepID=A0A0C3CN96_HEBCY|nr:hypothetical protein M413DRAFT_441938 [Hebeloma cylindrosporum h7]
MRAKGRRAFEWYRFAFKYAEYATLARIWVAKVQDHSGTGTIIISKPNWMLTSK